MPFASVQQSLKSMDERLLEALFVCHEQNKLPKVLYYLCLFCELSGHGVLWFGGVALTILLAPAKELRLLSLYMLLLLVLDVVLVAPVKVAFKRPRPAVNRGKEIMFSVSTVDSYAFPSGHASRAVAVAIFIIPWLSHTASVLVLLWAGCVCGTRILLGRHHPSDVAAGVLAGCIVAWCTSLVQGALQSPSLI